MKKVKIIVTAVVVLAIVGSAFAFKAKKTWVYCVTTGTANQNCFTMTGYKRTTGSGITRLYYPCWEGDLTACTNGGPNTCGTLATFTID
jgi:hypothetical protein